MGSFDQALPLADQQAQSAQKTSARPVEAEPHLGNGSAAEPAPRPNPSASRTGRGSFLLGLLRALSAIHS
jgi:hypothetical protein